MPTRGLPESHNSLDPRSFRPRLVKDERASDGVVGCIKITKRDSDMGACIYIYIYIYVMNTHIYGF